QLKLPYIYVRPKPKEHGLGNQIEGYFQKGQRTLIIEDLISTGKSSLQVVDVAREAGLDVIGMVSIFTYGFPHAEKAFADKGVNYLSLTNYEQLVTVAKEKGSISESIQKTLLNWREDPANWTGK
ncbi:MAG: orotate phosphoribosyltransferase, partial [Sphingobacteriales bacterium]